MLCFKKSAIPCSLATRVNRHVNPKLMRNIRVWQWRWMNSKIQKPFGGHWSLFEEAHGDVRGGKHRARFQEQIPCKLSRISSKMHLKFPGNFMPIVWNESIVSLWRKRHCFFETLTTAGAVFPPTGCLC